MDFEERRTVSYCFKYDFLEIIFQSMILAVPITAYINSMTNILSEKFREIIDMPKLPKYV